MPGSSLAPFNPLASLALAHPQDELKLEPVEGAAKWLGRVLHPLLFRMVSMVEQPSSVMSGSLSPISTYFRRDRHRHPQVDPSSYALRISGVPQPRSFGLDELRELPWEDRVLVMECAGNGNHIMGSAGLIGQARWSGPSLQTVLEACGGPGRSTHFAFHGLDPIPLIRKAYHYGLSLEELLEARALIALEMNGEPLPKARGFPARLVVPGIYSMSHVKWLGHIEGKTSPHMGIHNRWVFTNKELRNGRWVRVQARWIGLKSMITRCCRVPQGWLLTGWAWGGRNPIEAVKVTTDGGVTWERAELRSARECFVEGEDAGKPLAPNDVEHAWSVFNYLWRQPQPGDYRIASRAVGSGGVQQALEADPHVRGHFNQTRVKWRKVRVPQTPPPSP